MFLSAPQSAAAPQAATRAALPTYSMDDRVPLIETFAQARPTGPSSIGQEGRSGPAIVPGPTHGMDGTSCGTHSRPLRAYVPDSAPNAACPWCKRCLLYREPTTNRWPRLYTATGQGTNVNSRFAVGPDRTGFCTGFVLQARTGPKIQPCTSRSRETCPALKQMFVQPPGCGIICAWRFRHAGGLRAEPLHAGAREGDADG
jgi:hypothetical protein